MITRKAAQASAMPSHVWLNKIAGKPMSPIAGKLRKMVSEEILLDKSDVNFPEKLINAWQRYGFAVVNDSSIPGEIFPAAYDVNKEFFGRQLAYKEQLGFPSPENSAGYISPGGEVSVSAIGHDAMQENVFEMVHRSAEKSDNVILSDELGRRFDEASNKLADVLYDKSLELAHDISVGLRNKGFLDPSGKKLPGDYFVKLIEGANDRRSDLNLLRQTHCRAYPSDLKPIDGCSQAHTDLNFFTVLPAATREGLQIWYENEEKLDDSGWVMLDAPPGSYIVNLADMADILTGGYLQSTPHRVVSPIGEDRYSIIFFANLQRDVDLRKNKLTHSSFKEESPFESEAQNRIPGQNLTVGNFTNLRCMDIGIIPKDTGINKLGFKPLS